MRPCIEYHVFGTLPARYTCSLRRALQQQQTASEPRGESASRRTCVSSGVAVLDDAAVLALAEELGHAEQAVVAGEVPPVLRYMRLFRMSQ